MSSTQRGTVLQRLDRLFSDGTLAGLGDGELLERFRTRRDEAAFEALVELHGPMVLGLCRRFLRDPRDVEDAFQATFLVLVRRAGAIRNGGLLSSWLYGVALRVATRARTNLLRRRGREHSLGAAEFASTPDGHDMLGLGPVLDQELSRLPAKYRAPLVLCYLRGRTHDQAASELCCPVGTVRSRMARGRDLLKRRLTGRGCAPNAALFGLGLGEPWHLLTAALPERLVAATVDAAFAIGSTHTIKAGAALAPALALTQGVVTSMKFAQFKWIGLCILATGLSAGGAVVVAAVSAQSSGTASPSRLTAAAAVEAPQEPSTGTASTSKSTASAGSSKTTEQRLRALEQQVDRIYRLNGITRDTGGPGIPGDAPTLDRLEAKLLFLISKHDDEQSTGAGTATGTGTSSSSSPASTTPAAATTSTTSSGVTTGTRDSSTTNTASTGHTATSSSVASPRNLEERTAPERQGSSTRIRELESQLKQAVIAHTLVADLHRRHAVSQQEVQEYQARIDLTLATLKGMDDDFADDLEEAKLSVRRTKAEVDQASAQVEGPRVLVARNQRLNERQPGMVSEEDVAHAESDLRSGQAHARVKAVELEEAELQCRKVERFRTRIKEVLDSHTNVH